MGTGRLTLHAGELTGWLDKMGENLALIESMAALGVGEVNAWLGHNEVGTLSILLAMAERTWEELIDCGCGYEELVG